MAKKIKEVRTEMITFEWIYDVAEYLYIDYASWNPNDPYKPKENEQEKDLNNY